MTHIHHKKYRDGRSEMICRFFANPLIIIDLQKVVSTDEIAGRYYLEELGLDISGGYKAPSIIYLGKDGKVYRKASDDTISEGTYTVTDGKYYVHISIDDIEYSGVFCKQLDESGREVFVFSACGQNKTIYGVKYTE